MTGRPRQNLVQRFLSHLEVCPKSGCWLWKSYKTPRGYGSMGMPGQRPEIASRVSWRLYRGRIPEGMLVCHLCDVPACCNPDHLFLGTPQDNRLDALQKHGGGNSKLTWDEVFAIRASEESQEALAEKYGVSPKTVWAIRRGRSWNFGGFPVRRKRLTADEIEDIRTKGHCRRHYAEKYGISMRYVSAIWNGYVHCDTLPYCATAKERLSTSHAQNQTEQYA